MVLSNRKLKQKLREELSKSLVSSESKPSITSSTNPQSFTQLLGAAAHKPRLSKREKRRNNLPLDSATGEAEDPNSTASGPVDGGAQGIRVQNGSSANKERKKRKRDEGDGEVGVKDGSDSNKEEKKKKQQKKNKKKKKKKKTQKKVEDEVKEEPVQESEFVSETTKGDQIVAHKDEIVDGQGNEQVSNKVYVGGIPYYSTEDDIRSFFDHCGTITEVDCMKFPETGKFRGIAILEFKTEEAAKRAMALDGADMGGFFLKVQRYNKTTTRVEKTPAFSPPVIQGYNRIYAGNLSWDITEDDLRSFFSDCSVSSIRFGEDKETKEFKGYAHVDFSDSASLAKALEMDQKVVCGRPVRITCAVALRKGKPSQSTFGDKSQTFVVNNHHQSTTEAVVDQSTTVEAADSKVGMNMTTVAGNKAGVSLTTTTEVGAAQNKAEVSLTTTVGIAENKAVVSAGKLRRRNCYLCGERGHISSACPKQIDQETNPSTG